MQTEILESENKPTPPPIDGLGGPEGAGEFRVPGQHRAQRKRRGLAPLGVLLSTAWLAACGSGGDSASIVSSSPVPGATPGASPSPAAGPTPGTAAGPTPAPTEKAASRFLSQASLGATPASIERVKSIGYEAWIQEQMAMPTDTSRWDWLVDHGYLSAPTASQQGLDNMLWRKLIASPDTLRQRVTIALSEIFVVGANVTSNYRMFAIARYVDQLETHAFGNFRALLEAVTLNPAMGLWLNMLGNRKEDPVTGRVPDENYAREVMQLFTLGLYRLNGDGSLATGPDGKPIETYGQDDIAGLARVFTGWTYGTPRSNTSPEHLRVSMSLVAANHSTLEKQFLGTTIPAGTDGTTSLRLALDALFAHPNVGPFIGRQLIQRLVTSNPAPAYVARVSAVFENNGSGVRGDLAAVIRAVLLDADARNEAKIADPAWGKLREPMLRFVQWARSFGATSPTDLWNIGNTSDPATRLGQSPMRSPSVFNFFRPGYVPPNTSIGSLALVAPELQITNESSTIGYVNAMQTAVSSGFGEVKSVYPDQLPLATDAQTLVDQVSLLLAASQLSADTTSQIRSAVASMPASTETDRLRRVQAAVLLVMASTEYLVQK